MWCISISVFDSILYASTVGKRHAWLAQRIFIMNDHNKRHIIFHFIIHICPHVMFVQGSSRSPLQPTVTSLFLKHTKVWFIDEELGDVERWLIVLWLNQAARKCKLGIPATKNVAASTLELQMMTNIFVTAVIIMICYSSL